MLDCLDLDHGDLQSYQQMLDVLDPGPDGTSVLGHPDHIRQRPTYQMPATDHPSRMGNTLGQCLQHQILAF